MLTFASQCVRNIILNIYLRNQCGFCLRIIIAVHKAFNLVGTICVCSFFNAINITIIFIDISNFQCQISFIYFDFSRAILRIKRIILIKEVWIFTIILILFPRNI